MESKRQDELDDLIDRALAGYSGTEPLSGLEDRVLQRIGTAQTARRRRTRWGWALAIPALATLVLVGLALQPRETAKKEIATAPTVPEVTAPPSTPPLPAPPEPPRVASRRPGVLPKKDVFPTPSVLTPEERALAVLARSYPEELLRAGAEPAEIAPIEIPPLRMDDGR